MNIVAENIARRRKELGMMQKELAEKLDISDKTLSRWETDKRVPDALMIPEFAKALNLSISELYGVAESENKVVHNFKESEKMADSGKIAAYKIALLIGMFLCIIGGWIYLCWFGVPVRYGAIILLLLGIMTLLFAEIAYEESCLKKDYTEEYEKVHDRWFGTIVPIMGIVIGVVFPATKSAGLALFYSWDIVLPIMTLQLMVFCLYVRNYRRLKCSGRSFGKCEMMRVSICAAAGVILFLGYMIYSLINPYSNSLNLAGSYDEWIQKGGWMLSRILELGTGIAFFSMNLLYSKNILKIFQKSNENAGCKKIFLKAAKILVTVIIVICMITVPVIMSINRTLARYVSDISGMVEYEKIMAFEPNLIGWIHECNSGGKEVYALKRMTYVQSAEKYGNAYLFYFPHGCDLTETEVTYRLGTTGKTLKLKAENSSSIVGNSYYLCYVEVANDIEETELKICFEGEEQECQAEYTNLQLNVFEDKKA